MEGISLRRKREGVVATLAVALLVAALVLAYRPSPARAADADVTIQNFAFSPASVTVNVGDTVTWTNQESGVPHTTTSDTGVWDSGTLSTGQSFSFTFTQAGTFTYHCTIHPNMTGTVIVQAAATETATTTTATATTTTPTATPATPTATATATTTPGAVCRLEVANQTAEANSKDVYIARSQQSRAGYIAIHESNPQGNPGPVIGVSAYQPAGSNNLNVEIELDRAPTNGEKLWAMLHTEDNGNTTYDGAAVDKPTVDASCGNPALGNVVTFPFTVSVAVAPPSTGTGAGSDSNTTLYLAVAGIAGVIVLGGAGFAVARRRS